MFITTVTPTFADNNKDGKEDERYEEIDNYDFLYNDEAGNADFSFSSINNIMDEAFSHIGARYRSGQAGPYAFDCSGFTSFVFKNMGIDLNRSSRGQYTQGTPVGKDNLQTGDLVFFTSPGSGKRIGHVGIVVDVDQINGNFSFIHASRSGVKVSESDEAFYSRRYVGARRVM